MKFLEEKEGKKLFDIGVNLKNKTAGYFTSKTGLFRGIGMAEELQFGTC